MENNIVYEKEEENGSLNDESKKSFKTSQIEGSGSESLLESINSQPRDLTHSKSSSMKPFGQLSNSINNSNNNPINSNNEQSSISDGSIKEEINNMNTTTNLGPKSKMYNNFFSDDSKDKVSTNNSNNNSDIVGTNFQMGTEQFMKEVEEKINKGYIPFYLRAKGYKPYFYYGSQNSKFKKTVEHYIKKMNCPEKIKNTFYYNNKLIDINTIIKDLNIKPLSIISNEIK